MNNDDRYLELLAELVIKQDSTIDELKSIKTEVIGVKREIVEMKGELIEIKEDVKKSNLLSAENFPLNY